MSQNEKLSQEEINALLNRGEPVPPASTPSPEAQLTPEECDGVGEIGNISFGSAATALSVLLAQRVEITTPEVQVIRVEEAQDDFPRPYVVVTVDYTSGLTGLNALAIEINDAKIIADLMMGGDGTNVEQELNELHLSAVSEAMNQMMGGAATAMSTMFQRPINISPPVVKFVDFSSGDRPDLGDVEWVVNTSFRIRIGQLVDSRIMQWVPVTFAKEILHLAQVAFEGQSDTKTGANTQTSAGPSPAVGNHASTATGSTSSRQQNNAETNTGTSHSGNPNSSESVNKSAETRGDYGRDAQPSQRDQPQPAILRPQFQEFDESARSGPLPHNLSLLFDVQLTVTVELGRTKRPIREILELGPGSVVELDKLAGEPVDILVNNKRIAIGEVVVIDENFGVRVTDILSQADRVRSLQVER